VDQDEDAASKSDFDGEKTTLHREVTEGGFEDGKEEEEEEGAEEEEEEGEEEGGEEEEEEEEEEEGEEEGEEEEEEGEEKGEKGEEDEDEALPAAVVHQELADEEETASVVTEVSAATTTEQSDESLGYVPLVATSVAAISEQSRNIAFKREALHDLGVGALNRVKMNVNERLEALVKM